VNYDRWLQGRRRPVLFVIAAAAAVCLRLPVAEASPVTSLTPGSSEYDTATHVRWYVQVSLDELKQTDEGQPGSVGPMSLTTHEAINDLQAALATLTLNGVKDGTPLKRESEESVDPRVKAAMQSLSKDQQAQLEALMAKSATPTPTIRPDGTHMQRAGSAVRIAASLFDARPSGVESNRVMASIKKNVFEASEDVHLALRYAHLEP
jgi:hypothetical protein